MKSVLTLPEGYEKIQEIDVKEIKKQEFSLKILALVLMIYLLWNTQDEQRLPQFVIACLAFVSYILIYQFLQGMAMRAVSGQKVKFGFTSLYFYAHSEAFFGKRSSMAIAVMPVVVLGVFFFVASLFVPFSWRWLVSGLQILNVSSVVGVASDCRRILGLPKEALIQNKELLIGVFAQEMKHDDVGEAGKI